MARKRAGSSQAWIELLGPDAEAVSAFTVAKARIAAAIRLKHLRRFRLFELSGPLPSRAEQEDLLHRSTQFYNPHKERCTLRCEATDPVPLHPSERVALVCERSGARRPAAERWWRHETGKQIEVKEGVVWVLAFEPGLDEPACLRDLGTLSDRRHGLLCNPYAQEIRHTPGEPPLPWMVETESSGSKGNR